jgi:hypothetical protein
LFENGGDGSCDINPLRIPAQERNHYFVVALASRKNLSVLDYLQHLWRKERLMAIRNTYNNEFYHPPITQF